jgi:rod shape-determining protein MreB
VAVSLFQSLMDLFRENLGLFGGSTTVQSSANDIGIDLGTVNTLVCTASKGVVLREPSVVAVDKSQSPPKVLEVGAAARDMIGRTPEHIHAIRPLRDGVIAEFEWAEVLLRRFIDRALGDKVFSQGKPGRIIIGLPSGVTEVERRAVGDSAYNCGARIVNLIAEPMAAAIGAGMPVEQPTGSMIIDIGGGTTEVAVLSLNGIVVSKSLRIAGDELNSNIQQYMKTAHGLSIGDRTAEDIKIQLGSACELDKDSEKATMTIRGLNLATGLPDSLVITVPEVRACISGTLQKLVEGVKATLEITPPELAADIVEKGIVLAGGGALLRGMDAYIASHVAVPVYIAKDPLSCVVLGTERLLSDPTYEPILLASEYDPRHYH